VVVAALVAGQISWWLLGLLSFGVRLVGKKIAMEIKRAEGAGAMKALVRVTVMIMMVVLIAGPWMV
jgi:hypothetical protein